MYVVGGIDCNKGRGFFNFFVNVIVFYFFIKIILVLSKLMICYIKDEVYFLKKKGIMLFQCLRKVIKLVKIWVVYFKFFCFIRLIYILGVIIIEKYDLRINLWI